MFYSHFNLVDLSEEMDNFKLVLAEPLEGATDSHVRKFLEAHGGPGLQVNNF